MGRRSIIIIKDGRKVCAGCVEYLTIDKFYKKAKSPTGLDERCIRCRQKYKIDNKEKIRCSEENRAIVKTKTYNFRKNNEEIKADNQKYRENNREKIRLSNASYRQKAETKAKIKLYNESRVEVSRAYHLEYSSLPSTKKRREERRRNKADTDPAWKLRQNISTAIRDGLYRNNSSKNKESCIPYLEYTITELKAHLENQFEPWMNWSNHGNYRVAVWDDNDPATWTWQIDHTVPHSKFIYTSMQDEEFKRCWALSNLRPLSAKQNILDGNRRC